MSMAYDCSFTDAAYRFYRSRNEEMSARRRGTFVNKSKAKRRHERLARVSRNDMSVLNALILYKYLFK